MDVDWPQKGPHGNSNEGQFRNDKKKWTIATKADHEIGRRTVW